MRILLLLILLAVSTIRPAWSQSVHSFDLAIRRSALVAKPRLVRLKVGDAVAIRVVSDRADTLHLHGYDLSLPLIPGKPAVLRFYARHSGRFTCELHRADRLVAIIEVYPR